jgi:hypothetical protein
MLLGGDAGSSFEPHSSPTSWCKADFGLGGSGQDSCDCALQYCLWLGPVGVGIGKSAKQTRGEPKCLQ